MAGTSGVSGSSSSSAAHPGPKILLAKPASAGTGSAAGKFCRPGSGGATEDDGVSLRSRHPQLGSLNLLSDSWEFQIDRILPFLTDNTEFTVVGVLGPPGVGKSTIMNEIYGFDGSSPGILPPFAVESEETSVMARHCTIGIEPRISAERIILLDTQPVFSSSLLTETMRPDGSSTVPNMNGESVSAELAYDLMGIQLGVLLASVCHILLVVSEGVHDINMWRLLSTVHMLKHSIPDPSSLSSSHQHNSTPGQDKEKKDKVCEGGDEYLATPVFVHTKLRDRDLYPNNFVRMKAALAQYLRPSFTRIKSGVPEDPEGSAAPINKAHDFEPSPNLFLIPLKSRDDMQYMQYETFTSTLWKLRDQVLSMTHPSFARIVSERDWLKNSAKIWDLVKNSSIIADYSRMLQKSGVFRR